MTLCKHHHIFKLHLKILLKTANRNFLDNNFKKYHCKLNIELFIKYTYFWKNTCQIINSFCNNDATCMKIIVLLKQLKRKFIGKFQRMYKSTMLLIL